MQTRAFEVGLEGGRAVRFHSAGYLDDANGHVHIERDSLYRPEVQIVEHGILHIEIDGERIDAAAGTVLFMPAGVRQRGFRATAGRVRYVWMHFDGDVREVVHGERQADELAAGAGLTPGSRRRLRTAIVPLVMRPGRITDLLDIGHLIAESSAWAEPEKSALVTALLCRMTRAYVHKGRGDELSPGAKRVADIAAYIHSVAINNKLVKALSPRRVAEHFRINPIYLNRVFRKHTGTTLGARIIAERIAHARYLLSSGFSVKEAARDCGYSSSRYFARQFRQQTGAAPSIYRESTRF